VNRCFDLGCAGCEECCDDKDECRPMSAEQYWCVKCRETRSQGCFAKGCPGLPDRSAIAAAVFARTSPASLTEREQYIWTLGYAAGAGRSDGEPHASGSLPPLPAPTEMWATHDSTGRAVPAYRYTKHQMYEYARQSVHLVDENLLGFAQWLLDAYHSDAGMPEAKEIAKEARAAIAVAKPEGR
jgi:hypothetical protein